MTYERDLYTVNQDRTVTLHGWVEQRTNDIEEFENDHMPRHAFVTGRWPDLPQLDEPLVDWASRVPCSYQSLHYDDVPEFLMTFFDGTPGQHLPLRNVNERTPPGNYWCTFDEEPVPTRIPTSVTNRPNTEHEGLMEALRNLERSIRLHDCGILEPKTMHADFDTLLDELSSIGWLMPHEDDPATYTKA